MGVFVTAGAREQIRDQDRRNQPAAHADFLRARYAANHNKDREALTRVQPAAQATRCPALVEWLTADGEVLAASDYDDRLGYLAFACEHRAPRAASHWTQLTEPLVPFYVPDARPVR